VLKQLKSARNHGGRGLKIFGTKSFGETTSKTTSLKLIKQFSVSTLRSNSLQQNDCDALFEGQKSMYGSCYCFGMEQKHSINVTKIIQEAPLEMRVRSLE
jgi:hypothetical protein